MKKVQTDGSVLEGTPQELKEYESEKLMIPQRPVHEVTAQIEPKASPAQVPSLKVQSDGKLLSKVYERHNADRVNKMIQAVHYFKEQSMPKYDSMQKALNRSIAGNDYALFNEILYSLYPITLNQMRSSTLDKLERACDYFVKHKVSIWHVVQKFHLKRDKSGYEKFKRRLVELYPQNAKLLIDERQHVHSNARRVKYAHAPQVSDIELYRQAGEYFNEHPVSIWYVLNKFKLPKGNSGYARFKKMFKKMYPMTAREVLKSRWHAIVKKGHVHKKTIIVHKKPRSDDKRIPRMKYMASRMPRLLEQGMNKSEALKKASEEYNQKSAPTQASAPVQAPVPQAPKESGQAEPSPEIPFPMLYPVDKSGVKVLKEQVKYCITNKIPLEMRHVTGIPTVFGVAWNSKIWQSFCMQFVEHSAEIAQSLNIKNHFVLDVVSDNMKVRYDGDVTGI